MVRAGVVHHPQDWTHGGYAEIQNPPKRYRLIDLTSLMDLVGVGNLSKLQKRHREWIESQLGSVTARHENWTSSIAVGSESFANEIYNLLGYKVKSRNVLADQDKFVLKEPNVSYNAGFTPKIAVLRIENTLFWDAK